MDNPYNVRSWNGGTVQLPLQAQAKTFARENFSNCQVQLEEEMRDRLDRSGSKLDGVRDSMEKVVQAVQSEIKERQEANKALGVMFESQVQSIQDRLDAVFMKKLDHLDSSVAMLGQRMSAVEREFSLTREKHMQDISRRNHRLTEEVENCKSNLKREKEERKQRADEFAKQLSECEAQTRALIATQAQQREQKYQSLRARLDGLKQRSETGDDQIYSYLEEKVVGIKAMLAAEKTARTQADDDIMQALKHYTNCLQDALRTINQH
mmetsp:Transcript_61719/g.135200  ORF Transcript_61719/g.135200 Transcript_61719/m.135200 type:complete len:266 (+) Transcript_61719:34-831(+)